MKIKTILFTICALGLVAASVLVGNTHPVEAKKSTNNSRCSHSCNYTITKNQVTYSVTGGANYYCRIGWPSWGCEFIKNEIIEKLSPTNLSQTWSLSCGNIHSYTASIISVPVNGQCGSSNNASFTAFPTTGLCQNGTVANQVTGASTFSWTCAGSSGGTSASCMAHKVVNNTNGNPTDPNDPGTPGGPTCTSSQQFCSSLNTCIDKGTTCPNACARPVVPAGGGLNATTNGLCAAGFEPVATSIFARPSTNKWYWICKKAGTTDPGSQCEAACPTGTYYEGNKGYCATTCPDWCPNIDGAQTNIQDYVRDDNGHCITDGVIKYFRARPDTHETSCPSYWQTNVGPAAKMECKIDGVSVDANNLDVAGATGRPLEAGKLHILSCDVKLIEDNSLIKTLSASTRCFKPGTIIEN